MKLDLRFHRPRGGGVPVVFAGAIAILAAAGTSPGAQAWEIRPEAPRASLEAFHRHLGPALFAYPRHGAAPLGWSGFELYLDATYDAQLADEPFAQDVVRGDLPADLLSLVRVGARKGLPGGLDVGASYGRVAGSDLEIVSAELQWNLLRGRGALPAFAVRFAAGESRGEGAYELRQYGVDALVSKRLAFLTPYAGAGVVRSDGVFRRPGRRRLDVDETCGLLYAGVVLDFLLPRLKIEVERTETLQVTAGVGFGF